MDIEMLKGVHTSHPRNQLIADACFKAGYIDTWGRGTLKIINSCKKAGLPTPEIIEITGGIQVTLFKGNTQGSIKELDKTEQVTEQVENLIRYIENDEYSSAELMQLLEIKHRPTFLYNYLQKAIDFKVLEMTIPDKPNSSKQKYRLTEKGRKLKVSLKNYYGW